MTLILVAGTLLALLLAVARTRDGVRARAIAAAWTRVLTPAGREVLDYLVLAVREHRIGLEVLDRATRAKDASRLRRAVLVVEGFAPGLDEGLLACRNMSRVVSTLLPLPALRPLSWRAWELRGLAGVALVMHGALVATVERAQLRLWITGRALALGLRWLRASSERIDVDASEWEQVQLVLHDLAVVGDEAEATYRRVVGALDRVGGFAA